MRVLAMDTTAAPGSMALAEDGTVVEQVQMEAPGGFSRVLFAHVAELLARHGWALGDVDVFAAASGPGSFTGVRVGLAAVKGLAEATGTRALGVSNLHALASCATSEHGVPVIDARRDQVYSLVAGEQRVISVPEWLAALPPETAEFVAADAEFVRSIVSGTRFATVPVREKRLLADAIAALAFANPSPDAAAIDANYVRRSDAELFWREEPR